MWIQFLEQGTTSVWRPFMNLSQKVCAQELNFYTDTTKGMNLGMGGNYRTHSFFTQWEPNFIQDKDASSKYLELLGLCVGVFIWRRQLQNRRVIVFCDNRSVVTMVNNMTARCKNCMFLIRKLTLVGLKGNFRIFAKWVWGTSNIHADLLNHRKIVNYKRSTDRLWSNTFATWTVVSI